MPLYHHPDAATLAHMLNNAITQAIKDGKFKSMSAMEQWKFAQDWLRPHGAMLSPNGEICTDQPHPLTPVEEYYESLDTRAEGTTETSADVNDDSADSGVSG